MESGTTKATFQPFIGPTAKGSYTEEDDDGNEVKRFFNTHRWLDNEACRVHYKLKHELGGEPFNPTKRVINPVPMQAAPHLQSLRLVLRGDP